MEILHLIDTMAENGHAPDEGCGLFGIGNDDAIRRIRETYLIRRFLRGGSAEKFVVGPYGSGKTHFINQLLEAARGESCVTAKVNLTKSVDVTSNYMIYREFIRNLRTPESTPESEGEMKSLLIACMEKVKNDILRNGQTEKDANEYLRFWISGLENYHFELEIFGRVVKQAFDAYQKRNDEKFEFAYRWLSGEFDNKEINKMLNVSRISKSEQNIISKRSGLSLYQLIKRAGFTGTVVAFDEAEQGFSISSQKKSQLLSLLQSDINSINELHNGSALVLYAITPDISEEMMEFAALQQRVQDPFRGTSFWDGNTRAPLIYLTRRDGITRSEVADELTEIGRKLVELLYSKVGSEITVPREEVIEKIKSFAIAISNEDLSPSNRRKMVKGTCIMLIRLYEDGELVEPALGDDEDFEEDEA
ncbi:hypothetical protein FXW07_07990 [Methanosarcina sp. DH1]|uniref:BREX system ATP-binding domain-containing protein n=1 Tax=Methanosarcina sp. DH1 TaxID=2605695 RepID=UPI001E444B30|nr:BREX system ATP-binding domain-containing protein [Methanosarcina sp. DH1]MCC4766558.1 hypothetical protein [Methanosarcina sp. DH1]